jgi:hypothetical protein
MLQNIVIGAQQNVAELQDAAPLAMADVDLPVISIQGIRWRMSLVLEAKLDVDVLSDANDDELEYPKKKSSKKKWLLFDTCRSC